MKRVAIVGGKRVPFARSFSNYMGVSNQDLMLGAVKALVESYRLQDQVSQDQGQSIAQRR